MSTTATRFARVSNPTALRNLQRMMARIENPTIVFEDDYEALEARRVSEARMDPIGATDAEAAALEASEALVMKPHLAMETRVSAHMLLKSAEVAKHMPETRIRPTSTAKNEATDPTSINYKDPTDYQRTKLHKAVIDNDVKRVQKLVAEGADLMSRDISGQTPYSIALSEERNEITMLLAPLMQAIPAQQKIAKSA